MRTKIVVAMVCVLAGILVEAKGMGGEKSDSKKEPLPIIPGAHGFGMETPAGSGRHLNSATLAPDWDKALVAHWNFDDGKSVGTLTGDAKLVARNKGQALRLHGKGRLDLQRPKGAGKTPGNFTIMAWVRMETPGGTVARSAAKANGSWNIGYYNQVKWKWMFAVRHEGDRDKYVALLQNPPPPPPKWRHVAGAYDGVTGTLKLYVDGSLMRKITSEKVKGLAAARSTGLTIGAGVKGMIDDVMLFNASLNEEEILALYAHQHPSYFGANKTSVYKVTTLKTQGPGSLRAALDATGPRVIVFEVAGNIDFTPFGDLSIKNPYVTIAGQTAPSPGITLKGCQLLIRTHDVLLQHIRVRTGDLADPNRPIRAEKGIGWNQWSERDCMKVSGERIVIDHCSFSWSTDENVSSNASHLTFRHNIISEGLNSPKHNKGAHSKGLLIRGVSNDKCQQVAIIGNLFAHNAGRNPRVAGAARVAVINNLAYGGGLQEVCIHSNPKSKGSNPLHISTWIGNVMIVGPNNRNTKIMWFLDFSNAVGPPRGKCQTGRVFMGDMRVAYKGKDGAYTEEVVTGDPLKSRFLHASKIWIRGKWKLHPEKSVVKEPSVIVPGLQILPSEKVEKWVLANVGARPNDRDPVDARVVKNVRKRTGTIPKSQEDVGGWPKLKENHRKLTIPNNPSGDDDGDGYTNLEEWLHDFADKVEGKRK